MYKEIFPFHNSNSIFHVKHKLLDLVRGPRQELRGLLFLLIIISTTSLESTRGKLIGHDLERQTAANAYQNKRHISPPQKMHTICKNNSPNCTRCETEEGTFKHLFWRYGLENS